MAHPGEAPRLFWGSMHGWSRSPVLLNQDTQGLRVRKDSISIQAKVELTFKVLPTAIPAEEDPQMGHGGRAVGMGG